MSAVGSVLVQPQRLRRASAASPVGAFLEDVRIVASRVAADATAGGSMTDLVGAAVDAAAQRMIDRATGAARAETRLLALAAPLVDGLREQITALTATNPEDVPERIQELVAGVADAAAGLRAARVRSFVTDVLDILETDLRLTPRAVLGDLEALFDDVVERFEDVSAETDPAARKRRLDAARALRRIRRRLHDVDVPVPELNGTRIGDEIVDFLDRYGVSTRAERVACVGKSVGTAFGLGRNVLEVVPFTGFGSAGVGAATRGVTEDRLCWYATWLMSGKRDRAWYLKLRPGRDEVWIEAAANRIVLRTPGQDDAVLATGTTDWTQASIFKASTPQATLRELGLEAHYTIATPFGAEALEQTAYWTAVIGKALETALHLISLEAGDYASNTVNATASLATAIFELAQKEPFPWWFDWLTWVGTLFASLEGIHTNATAWNCFTMWITLVGPDAIEAYIYRTVAGTVRDAILSAMTLADHEHPSAPGVPRPQNRKEIDGVAEIGVMVTDKILMVAFPRDDYTIPGMGGGDHALRVLLGWLLLGGGIAGATGGFLGALLAKGIARTDDWSEFGRKIWWSIFWRWLLFFVSLNLEKEGKTSDGTYNPYPSPNGAPFKGYPAAASSPYNLPYESGRLVHVDQANLGLFSHNFLNVSQVYAYDFALDEGAEILACRPGTVVAWFDQTDDDTTGSWNFIIIKHDITDARTPVLPDPVHDLGPGGTPVTTYAVYGHGRKNSVRELFGDRGFTPGMLDAGGVTVDRGQPIMRSGDTGMSFHNHLHLHVVPDDGSGSRAGFTIPFVFQEVSRLLDTDGVCTRFNFYRSANAKV